MTILQYGLHYFLHLVFPVLVAWLFFRERWRQAYIIFLLTMLVDADHLLATPIFSASRCSIGYHPLHSYIAIGIYLIFFLFLKQYRIMAIGLLMHMVTDSIDCWISSLNNSF